MSEPRLRRGVSIRTEAPIYLLTLVVSSIATWFALDLQRANLRAPLEYQGDALAVGAHIKTVIETGWYESQPLLGAPAGQTYNDFPTADNLHFIAAKILALFTSDWAVAFNLYYIVGFPLAALAAVWFFRTLRVSAPVTIALATLFAIAPYHFMRGQGHLWLASYYAVPLAAGLLVIVLQRGRLWGRGTSSNAVVAWLLSPTSRTLLFTALLATSGSYYGVFFLFLIAFVGIAVLIRDHNWRGFLGAAAAGAFTVVVMLANMLPDIIYSATQGANPGGLERSHGEAEIYALKLTQLLMPWSGHRIPFLREIRELYDAHYPLLSERPALGLFGAVGLAIAMCAVAYLALVRVAASGRQPTEFVQRLGALSALVLVAFLLSTVGGLSTVVSFFTSALRGWNRMSIVILILCLGIVGIVVDQLIRRFSPERMWSPRPQRIIAAGAAVVILGVGFVDQTPSDLTGQYRQASTAYAEDEDWFQTIDDALPAGADVLQLPYVPFPESSSATGVLGSEVLVPYLHTSDLNWSGAGIKGRPRSDYPLALQQFQPSEIATLAAAAGFEAIMVDKRALPDPSAMEDGLTAAAGAPLESDSGRYLYFDLSDVATTLEASASADQISEAGELVVNPVTGYFGPEFSQRYDEAGLPLYDTGLGDAPIRIVNDTGSPRNVHISLEVLTEDADATAQLQFNGRTVSGRAENGVIVLEGDFLAEAGSHTASLGVSSEPQPFAVGNFRVIAEPVQELIEAQTK
ncbi:hypothetical protein [Diaminobutyricimonas sp. LJ205]|uniref:hypothetical protein n=1 Tax=Diaminobutyricimonas sp. LJ205 TaxID=2683590 RepID=UPI0012F50175|nr:hypothetical protein [Diaminobutyricimonas sp. LJ205]